MELQKNPFKAALQRPEPQFGLWLGLADSYPAEICAGAGFDWLLIDGEHAPNDVRTILAQLQALAPYPVHPIVRPPVGQVHLIKQLLDIGAQSLLIPMVETAEDAHVLVAATRYPPAGIRGLAISLGRASRWNSVPNYLQTCDSEICLIVQVETRKALEHLEAIAAVDGVDAIFIGPSDLSAALGHRGNLGHPEVQAAIESAIARIRAAGKPVGILATEEALIRRYISLQCSFIAVGSDIGLLSRASQDLARKFKPGASAPASSSATY